PRRDRFTDEIQQIHVPALPCLRRLGSEFRLENAATTSYGDHGGERMGRGGTFRLQMYRESHARAIAILTFRSRRRRLERGSDSGAIGRFHHDESDAPRA